MRHRLLTDTCAALKLAALGTVLFEKGRLPRGDLILHPLTFAETKKWFPEKKNKLKPELDVLASVRPTAGLAPNATEIKAQVMIIEMTQDQLGASIGRTDEEILAAILIDGEMGLVSNDRAFCEVASDGFDVEVASAEEIVLEALDSGVVSLEACQNAVKRWNTTNSYVLTEFAKTFREKKLLI